MLNYNLYDCTICHDENHTPHADVFKTTTFDNTVTTLHTYVCRCMFNVYVLLGQLFVYGIFVDINIVYSLRYTHTLIIVKSTVNTQVVREYSYPHNR